ncbi:MAG: UDP-N-acetylmuramate--L-alanine ligase [Bdellovibrionales bacterium]|nr:UDP-N-acetylmuramate--L-alanine ligase [Bdellovibrionales bacterium]
MKKAHQLHFVGIGGIGMSGIAEIFLTQGMRVSGSDQTRSETTERLERLGAKVFLGHDRSHVQNSDVVVISSAVKADNPEVLEARGRGIPVIPRAEMLAEIMRGKTGLAIAGTHGKTTTTSMTAQILMKADLDPTVVVGGKVQAIGSNAKMGSGDLVVVEADESDGSFHLLPATFAVITNVDTDHMEFYQTRENLDQAFVDFVRKLPFYGRVWVCLEDPGVRSILPAVTKPYSTYGFTENADLFAKNLRTQPGGRQIFDLHYRDHPAGLHRFLGTITLKVLGRHNVLNALGAIGVSFSAGADFKAAKAALAEFQHVKRRFDERFFSERSGIRIIDDYGHHPTEIEAVLQTARQTEPGRIITVFQPHRYSRTRLCWREFLSCFSETEELILLPVYAASEEPIDGVTSEALAVAITAVASGRKPRVRVAKTLEEAALLVTKDVQSRDLILTLGAGSITKLPELLIPLLS